MSSSRPILYSLLLATACNVANADEPVSFNREVLSILSDNCFQCHGPDAHSRQANLRLDTQAGAYGVGDSGVAAIVPGRSADSELIRRITSKDAAEQMPPPKSNRKLSAAQLETLRRWVDEGAAWGKHWAFETPLRPKVPDVKNQAWARNPIDRFVLARLEKEKLSPSPEASPETLIRRLSLDLTGLPPTPAEVDAFVRTISTPAPSATVPTAEPSAWNGAYAALVDRLLASPRYGQRWAWDWLDAARYADTNGYQGDPERTMWPWRDWVVDALNANMPYDQFTVEQLAGDLLPGATHNQILATGFNRNHMHNGEGGRIAEETRVENVFDRVETTSTVWLGLTVGCARCHDHKFDPITQREYYQLFDYFNQTSEDGSGRSGQAKPVVEMITDEQKAKLAALRKTLRELSDAVAAMEPSVIPCPDDEPFSQSQRTAKLTEASRYALDKPPQSRGSNVWTECIAEFKATDPEYAALLQKLLKANEAVSVADRQLARSMVMDQLAKPRDTFILVKGAYDKPGEKVVAGVPASLPPLPADAPRDRLALARWLVSRENPLTARVTVNRYWQALFGVGLVKTVEDFGLQGERPVNQDLLDWLAVEFVDSGWDVKQLLKLIVTSSTYRQSSAVTRALWERDPDNRLLARGARYRMPSWMLRDQALAVSGLLVDKRGGPSVRPYQPAGIWEEATFGKTTYKPDNGDALYRRTLYTFWRRIVGPTMLFDNSARQVCAVKQVRTNTPLHALTTLNETLYVEAARALAQQMLETESAADDERLNALFVRVTCRRPTPPERDILRGRLSALRQQYARDGAAALELLKVGESKRNERLDPVEHAAWTGVCSLLLNLDETLTRE